MAERVAFFVSYDEILVSPEYMSEVLYQLEGVESVYIEEAD